MTHASENLSPMAERQRRLLRQRADAVAARKAMAFEEIKVLVERFRAADPDIGRIFLFGSLARDDVRSPDFDIDLAVVCSGGNFLKLVAIALDSRFSVDVVDLSTADDRIRTAVAREGVVLYEK